MLGLCMYVLTFILIHADMNEYVGMYICYICIYIGR